MKAVNFIRGRAFQHRLFKAFCEELGANCSVLLRRTEVKWLSKGRVLNHVVQSFQEMSVFLQEAGHPKAIDFKDEKFLLIMSCLADIFGHLNILNVKKFNALRWPNLNFLL